MGYVGNQQTEGFSQVPAKQDLTGATGTSLTLTHAVASAEGIDLFINNVRQEPTTAYSVGSDGVTVTLTGSVVATDDIYVVYNSLARQTSTHPSNQALQATSGTFSGTVTANAFSGDGSSLTGVGVAGISSSSTSGTAINIDANNIVTTPSKPMMSVRGQTSSTLNAATGMSSFREVTGWVAVDVDVGNCLQNGRFRAPVTGVYHLSAWSQAGTSTDYRYCAMYLYNGSTYERLFQVYSYNDYSDYTIGSSLLKSLNANDEILVGWDNNYSNWSTSREQNSFTAYLVS